MYLINRTLGKLSTGIGQFELFLELCNFVFELVLFFGVLKSRKCSIVSLPYFDCNGLGVLDFCLELADLGLQITALGLKLLGTFDDTLEVALNHLESVEYLKKRNFNLQLAVDVLILVVGSGGNRICLLQLGLHRLQGLLGGEGARLT